MPWLPGSLLLRVPELTVYCARPMTGHNPVTVLEYYQRVGCRLSEAGFYVLVPTIGKGHTTKWTKDSIKRVRTSHAIKERDKWMVQNSQVIFVNLLDTSFVSIGSIMELAWADMLGVHSVVALAEENIHCHHFVRDCADVIFPTEEEALLYLEKLASGIPI